MASQDTQLPAAPSRAAENQQQIMPSSHLGGYPPFGGYQPCFMMPFPPPASSGGSMPPWPYPPMPANSWGPHPPCAPRQVDQAPDHYTVDSMRRIYSNEDASIEIERVKVQRRQQQFAPSQSFPYPYFPPNFPPNFTSCFHPNFPPNFPPNFANMGTDSKGIVPAIGPNAAPIRRPPPRKNRKNKLSNQLVASHPLSSSPHPQGYQYPTPYISYVPYPYPYPYFSYPALESSPIRPELPPAKISTNSETCQNELTQRKLHEESFDSQRIDSGQSHLIRDSISPDAVRPLSPNAPSQVSLTTESLGTDINPSDSVSVGGYRKSGRTSQHEDDRDNHWMIEMQKHLASIDALSEEGDRSSFATALSDVPTPPVRRRRAKLDSKQTSIDSTSENVKRVPEPHKHSSLDISQQNRHPIIQDGLSRTPKQLNEKLTPSDICKKTNSGKEEILQSSQAPNQNIKQTGGLCDTTEQGRPTSDPNARVTKPRASNTDQVKLDSTEIPNTNFDYKGEETVIKEPSPSGVKDGEVEAVLEDHSWVLLTKDEAPDVASVWLADVSVWRARLVVSLDKGQGLDQQDWATFHLLTQHPLPVTLKLSMLHAPRLCAANGNVGAVQVRAALLQLARYAQILLQQEEDRPSGWRSISDLASQAWAPVKGGKEILRLLGFRPRDDGTLRYSRRLSLEVSHVARLTLDMLLLADELRLYLTGGHPHPSNISDLFCPTTVLSPSSNRLTHQADGQSMPAYHSSADFISAETTPVFGRKADQDNQEQDKYDAVRESRVKVSYNEQLLHRTSSEEDITLHEDGALEDGPKRNGTVTEGDTGKIMPRPPSASSQGCASTVLSDAVSVSTDIASLPELQSASSPVPPKTDLDKTSRESSKTEDTRLSSGNTNTLGKSVASHTGPINARREDHIYEEIGDIKSQVQKLRASVSVPNLPPPPLPPKYHSIDEDNSSTYSRSDWSASSSVGGSTGRRRRKRRAPLPPSFMRLSIKENLSPQGSQLDHLSHIGQKTNQPGRNPFYDEIGENKPKLPVLEEQKDQEGRGTNPFYDTKLTPSGYVGANPFYEDVKKVNIFSKTNDKNACSGDTPNDPQSSNADMRVISQNQLHVQSETEKSENENNVPLKSQDNHRTLSPEHQKNETIVPSNMELHDVDLNSNTGGTAPISSQVIDRRSLQTQTKNAEQKQLRGSQGVVSADLTCTESVSLSTQSNAVSMTPINLELNESETGSLTRRDNIPTDENLECVKCSPSSSEPYQINETEQFENRHPLNERREIESEALPSDTIILNMNETKAAISVTSSVSSPEIQPSRLSVISDIPYIDLSDVSSYKALMNSNSQTLSEKINLTNKIATNVSNTPPLDPPPPPPPPCSPPPLSDDMEGHNENLSSQLSEVNDSFISSSSITKLDLLEPIDNTEGSTLIPMATADDKSNDKNCVTVPIITGNGEQLQKLRSEETDVKSPVIFRSSETKHSDVAQRPACGEYYEIPANPDQPPPLPAKPNTLRSQKAPELPPKLLKSISVCEIGSSETDNEIEETTRTELTPGLRKNSVPQSDREIPNFPEPAGSNDTNFALLNLSESEKGLKVTDDNDRKDELGSLKGGISFEESKNVTDKSPPKPPRRHRLSPQSSTMPRLPPKTRNASLSKTHTKQQKCNTLPSVAGGSVNSKKNIATQLSSSTPSSPKPTIKPPPAKFTQESKTRKSWPFLLCDCLYTDNDKNESVIPARRF